MADFVKLNGYDVKDVISRNKNVELENSFLNDTQKLSNHSLTSIYQGNYIVPIEYLPSAVLKIDNVIYTFNVSNSNPLNDTGKLIGFDLITNKKTIERNILISHANSVCYNPITKRVYIVPTNEYSIGDTNPLFLYEYDKNFNYIGKMSVPEKAGSISYDFVNNKMYMKSSSLNLYVFENDSWTLLYPLNLPTLNLFGTINRQYNQGMAVYDGLAYISSPYRNVIVIDIETGNIVDSFVLTDTDNRNVYILKELEDFEFTSDGHLLAIRYTKLREQANMGFVVELPVNQISPYAPSSDNFDVFIASYNLTSDNVDDFSKSPSFLTSLMELRARTTQPSTVIITGNVIDDYNITIMNDVELQFTSGAKYTCKSIEVYAHLVLRPTANSCRLIFTNTNNVDIALYRKALLSTCGGFYMYMTPSVENGDVNIDCSIYFPQIIILARPRIDGTGSINIKTQSLGTTQITQDLKYYIGNKEIIFDN